MNTLCLVVLVNYITCVLSQGTWGVSGTHDRSGTGVRGEIGRQFDRGNINGYVDHHSRFGTNVGGRGEYSHRGMTGALEGSRHLQSGTNRYRAELGKEFHRGQGSIGGFVERNSHGGGTTGGIVGRLRFRRDVEDQEPEYQGEEHVISRRSPFREGERTFPSPGQQGNDKGTWSVSSNKDKGHGTQIRAEGERNIYDNGKTRVDVRGHWEAGKGRKPDTGVGIKAQGRWRRDVYDDVKEFEVADEENAGERMKRSPKSKDDKGTWSVTANHDHHNGPRVRAEAEREIYSNGNTRVHAGGHWEGGRGRPDYGVRVGASGRFRRDVSDDETRVRRAAKDPKTTVNVGVDAGRRRKPTTNAQVDHRVWQSPKKDSSVHVGGQGRWGNGKPNYSVGATYVKRF